MSGQSAPHPLVIDARPRGPRGPLAGEPVLGRTVLSHLLELALGLDAGPVVIHARFDEQPRFRALIADRDADRVVFATGSPPEGAAVLRTDRLYDPSRLRRAWRKGRDLESAAIWRLDQPQGLAGVDDEFARRQSYQPLGRYWALGPARCLARVLRPTLVRPNALTLASGTLMLSAAGLVAFGPADLGTRAAAGFAMALALVLDTSDGHLARLQGTASAFGRWLDAYLDELGDMALHAAIAWAAFVRDGQPAWLVVGMIYAMGKHLFVFGTEQASDGEAPQVPAIGHPAPAPALKRWVRLAGHADVRWHLWIALAVVGRLDVALAAYAAYFPARALAVAAGKAVRRA